jgi:hypothetical protein
LIGGAARTLGGKAGDVKRRAMRSSKLDGDRTENPRSRKRARYTQQFQPGSLQTNFVIPAEAGTHTG